MMGYTHAIIGAAGALAVASMFGDTSPESYVMVVAAGTLGGVAVDIDTKDNFTNPKVTDAGRSRLATLGLLCLSAALTFFFQYGMMKEIMSRGVVALVGSIAFLIILLIGFFTEHRTFSHSLLFVILSSIGVLLIIGDYAAYYSVGCVLHIVFDMLNHKYQNHGIWLFYPIKTGNGIALGWCKSARLGNKVFYFIGLVFYVLLSGLFFVCFQDNSNLLAPIIIFVYTLIAFHFVRRKSEKEQRHIMHMRGEI